MTAKHRKGRASNKQEENSFKYEAPERDPRRGGAWALHSVLLLTVLIGGSIVAWFCLQQHQNSASLADNLVAMQMKIVKLQALQEEVRMAADKLLILDGFESRIQALEEANSQAQKKVGPAVTSDLPSQVLALRVEVARLAEWQQEAVTPEQLKEVWRILEKRAGELDSVRSELVALKVLRSPARHGFEGEEDTMDAEDLTSLLEIHAVEVTNLKRLLARHKAQLDAATRDISDVRELLRDKPRSRTREVQDMHGLQSEEQSTASQDLQAQVETDQNQTDQLDVAIPEGVPSEESVVLIHEEEQSEHSVKEEEEMAHADFVSEEDGLPGEPEASVTGAQGQEVAMAEEKELWVMEEQEMEVTEEQELGDTKQEEEVTEEEELEVTMEEEELTEEEEELEDSEEEEELGDTERGEELGDTKEEEVTEEADFEDSEEEEELKDREDEKEVTEEEKLEHMEEEELGHIKEEAEDVEDIEEEEEQLGNAEEDKEITEEEKLEDMVEDELGHLEEEEEEEEVMEEGEETEEEEDLEDTEEEEELGNTKEDKEVTEEEEPKDANKQVKMDEEMTEDQELGDMKVVRKEEKEKKLEDTEVEEQGDPEAQGEEEQEAPESGTEEEEQKRMAAQGKKEQ